MLINLFGRASTNEYMQNHDPKASVSQAPSSNEAHVALSLLQYSPSSLNKRGIGSHPSLSATRRISSAMPCDDFRLGQRRRVSLRYEKTAGFTCLCVLGWAPLKL